MCDSICLSPSAARRKAPRGFDDEEALTGDIIELARQYGRYGYRKIAALLRDAGWLVNDKRIERIWRCEGLKVPAKQPKKGRLWLGDGSCIRLRPEHLSSDIRNWTLCGVRNWTHFVRLMRLPWLTQGPFAEVRCVAFREDGSCHPGW
jgi:putative transposase